MQDEKMEGSNGQSIFERTQQRLHQIVQDLRLEFDLEDISDALELEAKNLRKEIRNRDNINSIAA